MVQMSRESVFARCIELRAATQLNKPIEPAGRWGRLSDEELIRIRFTTDDPEGLEGLIHSVPPVDSRPFVEFGYDFRGSKRSMIRCAHCKYPNHLAGFVIRVDDGSRFLCGHRCGAKIYGVDFEALHRDYSQARDRASLLHRVAKLKQALPGFVRYLADLKRDSAFQQYSDTRQALRSGMQRLWGGLRAATERSGGILHIEERVRDFEAEARDEARYEREMEDWQQATLTERKRWRREGAAPRKPQTPIYKTVPRPIGSVGAGTFFSSTNAPRRDLEDIAAQFESLAVDPVSAMSAFEKLHYFGYNGRKDARGSFMRLAFGFGDTSNKGMATLLKQVSVLLERIEEQIDRLAELPALFQPAKLELIANWGTAHHLGGHFRAERRTLIFAHDAGSIHQVGLPAGYSVPSKAGIELLRATMSDKQGLADGMGRVIPDSPGHGDLT
ncbi:hypothetical protein [Mesorhizobium sp. CA12]|uniref:hypothetical protein n=1 Tax=Mesorhizobium sp. CA12 TaxID=2876644 RepID=UPI001CCF705F|nr:hypothetical protein [Mesorhizobium sp. CA12]